MARLQWIGYSMLVILVWVVIFATGQQATKEDDSVLSTKKKDDFLAALDDFLKYIEPYVKPEIILYARHTISAVVFLGGLSFNLQRILAFLRAPRVSIYLFLLFLLFSFFISTDLSTIQTYWALELPDTLANMHAAIRSSTNFVAFTIFLRNTCWYLLILGALTPYFVASTVWPMFIFYLCLILTISGVPFLPVITMFLSIVYAFVVGRYWDVVAFLMTIVVIGIQIVLFPVKIPQNRENEIQEYFNTFDTNKDGTLDREEFSAFIWTFQPTANVVQIASLFKFADEDGDGTITWIEFKRYQQRTWNLTKRVD